MAGDRKISELPSLVQNQVNITTDVLPIVTPSDTIKNKKITAQALVNAVTSTMGLISSSAQITALGFISESQSSTILTHLELTSSPFIYEPIVSTVTFTKENYGDQVDTIDTNVGITRRNNQGIYNPFLETEWDSTTSDGVSPTGSLWNVDGWGDLTNLDQRRYFSFYDAHTGSLGNNVLSAEQVMYDTFNDKYYKFDFTVWGNSGVGAPVTYTRTQINPTTGAVIGEPFTFVKAGYEDPTTVNDPIDTNMTFARGNNQGLYNIALEAAWSTAGDGEASPEGTEWNADGWDNLELVSQRTYTSFYDALGGNIGENIVGTELVMHDTINDKYYTFKFSGWTQNNQGGGFSYTRGLINTSNLFVKPDNDTETRDVFVEDDIAITRDENGGIYNPYRDNDGWNEDVSPDGTLWNIEGWDDLRDVTTRNYQPFYAAFGYGGLGNKVVGTECVMYIPDTDTYYAIKFLSWTQGGGGGFSYLRYQIDTDSLAEGIRFADGTSLKTASGLGKVKARFAGNRRIEEQTGYIVVSVTEAITSSSVEATVYQNNNGNFDFYVVHTTEIETLYDNQDSFTKLEFSFDGGSTWKETVFGGGSRGNWWQLYFPDSNPENYETVTAGQTLLYRVTVGGAPVRWFNAEGDNFRGAVIEYHAYSQDAGTIIGTIHIADDDGDDNINHTETFSGDDSDLAQVELWYRNPEGNEREIWFRRLDGEADTVKIQWIARMFYGSEYYD